MTTVRELKPPDIGDRVFERVAELAYSIAGIRLTKDKRELVKSRLIKRIRALGLDGFDDYLARVEADRTGDELARMIDVLTTNKTNFFREPAHFDYLRAVVLPDARTRGRRIRIWSAACSSGEEPYTISMVLREEIHDLDAWDAKILASDISARMIEAATNGVYRVDQVEGIGDALRRKYFTGNAATGFSVAEPVRRVVSFARLNLMADWPMRGPFDVVFCRNVMIYFDKATQERLVNRFHELIRPGGFLFVGHSESLTPLEHSYEFVQPAIYRRRS